MSKIEIKFNLDSIEDKDEIEMLLNKHKYYSALLDIGNFIRTKAKYENIESISIEELSKEFWEIIHNNDIRDL